jgi:hypothetical protein
MNGTVFQHHQAGPAHDAPDLEMGYNKVFAPISPYSRIALIEPASSTEGNVAASKLRPRCVKDWSKARHQRWLGESGQGDKWIFCLRAAQIAADQEAFKAKVALAAIKGEKTLAELAQLF